MKLNLRSHQQQRRRNQIHFWVLITLLAGFCYLLASWVLGEDAGIAILLALFILLGFNPLVSPTLLLRLHRAQPLPQHFAPDLHHINQLLASRAELEYAPRLYFIPNNSMNAFTSGSGKDSVIALSAGLFQQLNLKQLAGVIAHEMSHIRHHDMQILGFVATFSQLARTIAFVGILTLLISIPTWLAGGVSIGLIPLLLMLFAPTISAIIEFAIMRNREFDADTSAAELMGDPEPLMQALAILERQATSWERYFIIERQNPWFKTHPDSEERISRLAELEAMPWVHHPLGTILNNSIDVNHHFPPRSRNRFW